MIYLTLFSPSAVASIQRLCYIQEENTSGLSVSELRYRTFTEKNLSGYRLPSTLDALVLHLRRAFIFFLNFLTSFIKNIKYVIEKIFLFVQNSSLHKTNFFSQMNL